MNETTELIMKQLNSKKVHAETHEVGGGDEIDVLKLKNVDALERIDHSNKHEIGGSDEIDVTKLRNIDQYVTVDGNFTGTWNGIEMTSTEPGLSSAFDALKADVTSVGANVESFAIQFPEVDDTARIQRAIDAAGSTGRVIIPPKTYNISGKITFTGHVFATGATFNVTSNIPIAVEVREGSGTTLYQGKTAYLPNVVKQTKTWDGTDTGVQVTNIYQSYFYFGKISGFSTGLLIGGSGTGNSYNNYFLGYLLDNKVNLRLAPLDAAGWVNENNFYGGRFGFSSSNGNNVPGTRHILISNATFTPNNNAFYKPSIEGDTPEYQIECWGGYNYFFGARYEATTPKVAWRGTASSNVIFHGYGAASIVFEEEAGTKWNTIYATGRTRMHGSSSGSVMSLQNTAGGANFMLAGLDSSSNMNTNPATDYVFGFGQGDARFKRKTDIYARVKIDFQNGRMGFSNGTADPTKFLSNYGSNIGVEGSNLQLVGGAWNTEHLLLGIYHLWVDSTGKLRIKASAPTSDLDGTIVGTQT